MWTKYSLFPIILICCIFFCFNVDTGYSQTWKDYEDIYVVWPKKAQGKSKQGKKVQRKEEAEGGTFYVRKAENGKYPPEGYLPTMTLIKVLRDKDNTLKEELVPENLIKGKKFPYLEFIGSDGSFGYVKKNSIRPLKDLFKGQKQPPSSSWNLLMPTHFRDEVRIYELPSDNKELPSKVAHHFNRSYPDIVVTNKNVVSYFDKEGAKIYYYEVKFFKNKKDGENGLVMVSGLDETYRIFRINPFLYKKITELPREKDGFYVALKRFVERFHDKDAVKKLIMLYYKTAEKKIEIDVEFKPLEVIPFKPFGISVRDKWTFPEGYRYSLDHYEGFFADRKIEVMSEIKCEHSSFKYLDHYTKMMFISGIAGSNDPHHIDCDTLSKKYKRYFTKPDIIGPYEKHVKMLALTRQKDYFAAFYSLGNYLDDKILYNIEDPVEKQQCRSLLIRLIVNCSDYSPVNKN